MGLIGSSFLSNLVTPPLHWQEQEVPVYVIPDNIQLSEVHHLRLNELGLAIGIPFQITQSNPNERLLAKIMESEAIRSVVTIVEDSVELREFTNSSSQSAAEALTTLLAESSPGNTTGTTTNNNQLKLLFQYTAMEEFELKIEIYVKLSNNVQKISMDRVALSCEPIIVPAGMKASFDSSKFGVIIDMKQLPGVVGRNKKLKAAIFDIVLIASSASNSSLNIANLGSSQRFNKGHIPSTGGSLDGLDDDLALVDKTSTVDHNEGTNADQHLVIVGKVRTNWSSPWKSAMKAGVIYPSTSLLRSKPSGNNLLSAALDNSKLFWLKDAGYSLITVLKEAYFFRVNTATVENFMLHRKLQREDARQRRSSLRRASVGGGKTKKLYDGVETGNPEVSPRRSSMSSNTGQGTRTRKKIGNKWKGPAAFEELPTAEEHIPPVEPAQASETELDIKIVNPQKESPKKLHKGSRVDSMSLQELSDDSEVDMVKKDIDDIIADYQKQRQQSSMDNSGGNVEMRSGSEVSSVDHNISPRDNGGTNMIVDLLVPNSMKKVMSPIATIKVPVSSNPTNEAPASNTVTTSETSPAIKLDLIHHKYEMNKGVYDSMAIYGADPKQEKLQKLFKKHEEGEANEPEGEKAEGEEEENSDNMCVVCLSSEKEVVLYPCRHCNMCIDCAKMISDQGRKCPVCRQLVTLLIHLH